VRKLFASRIDKFIRKYCPLEFEYKSRVPPGTVKTDEEEAGAVGGAVGSDVDGADSHVTTRKEKYKVVVTRKYQGPATTLLVECNNMEFTIDLVNSLHGMHIRYVCQCKCLNYE